MVGSIAVFNLLRQVKMSAIPLMMSAIRLSFIEWDFLARLGVFLTRLEHLTRFHPLGKNGGRLLPLSRLYQTSHFNGGDWNDG